MRQIQNALNENHAMLIKYKCTSCDGGEQDLTLEEHSDPATYWECECGEQMLPANHEYIYEIEDQLAAHAEVVEAAREVINTSMVVGDTSVVNTKELMSLAAALAKLEAWK